MRRILWLPVLFLSALLGCDLTVGQAGDGQSTLSDSLPEDIINDVLRQPGFEYEVLAPVRLVIEVTQVEPAAGARALADPLFVVRLVDNVGTELFTGSTQPGTAMEAEVLVATDMPEMVLTLDSPNHEVREVVISQPARYSEVNRVMAAKVKDKNRNDRDSDGIDDYYDAFPDDPTLAFTRSIPTSNHLRIAFEDNFPGLGDGDYNDFVADYRIVEYRGAKNNLVSISGSARAVARGAGFDHEFGLVVACPGLTGLVSVQRYNGNGQSLGSDSFSAVDSVRIVLFVSSKAAFDRAGESVTMDNVDPDLPPSLGHTTLFTITFDNTGDVTASDTFVPYNPYLLIDNPSLEYRPDVHLIGDEPLADSQNPPGFKDFRDENGYPRALLVPDTWMPPAERTHIETAYPDFLTWRESMGADRSDWYFYPDEDHVCPIP